MSNYIEGHNMTNFFNREMMMYSIGDIRFKKPVPLKLVLYTVVFLIFWTIPLILFVGIYFNLIYFTFLIGPPLALGYFSTKKMFYGKNIIEFTKTIIKHQFQEPRGWTDLKNNNSRGKDVYYVENPIWIGRRREIQILADLEEKNQKEKNNE